MRCDTAERMSSRPPPGRWTGNVRAPLPSALVVSCMCDEPPAGMKGYRNGRRERNQRENPPASSRTPPASGQNPALRGAASDGAAMRETGVQADGRMVQAPDAGCRAAFMILAIPRPGSPHLPPYAPKQALALTVRWQESYPSGNLGHFRKPPTHVRCNHGPKSKGTKFPAVAGPAGDRGRRGISARPPGHPPDP